MSKFTLLPIDQIGYDPEFYPRVNGKEDWLTVHRYKEVLGSAPWKSDASKPGAFPPVIVVKASGYDWTYLILDGLHRLRAWEAAGLERIPAVIEALPKSKWLERSVELNVDSKRPLDSGDKRWVATKLMADGWTVSKVATLLCMEKASLEKLVATNITKLTQSSAKNILRGRSNREVNGEHYGFLKAPFSPISGTGNAQKALRTQAAVSCREANQIIESFIALLESRAIDPTDEHTSGLLNRVRELLEETAVAA